MPSLSAELLFGHGALHCNEMPQCVKCTGNHLTINCTKRLRDENVRCSNCHGDHPANYRQCPTFIKYRENQINLKLQQRNAAGSNNLQPDPHRSVNQFTRPSISYANILPPQQSQPAVATQAVLHQTASASQPNNSSSNLPPLLMNSKPNN